MLSVKACLATVAIAAFLAVGCAAAPNVAESSGAATSHELAGSKSDDSATLDALADKINNCSTLTAAEYATLQDFTPSPFEFSAQVYVYISCSTSTDGVISASAEIQQRAGYSTEDGAFTETSISGTTSLDIPVKVVDVSGNVTFEQTIRTSGGTTFDESSTSVGIDVDKDFAVAKASVGADFDGSSVTVSGNVSSIEIPVSACNGSDGSVGVHVDLTGKPTHETVDAGTRSRAQVLLAQNGDNNSVLNAVAQTNPAEGQRLCCQAQGTCTK